MEKTSEKNTLPQQLHIIKQCRDEGLFLWECPNFLFLFTGLISILSMTISYYISSIYFQPEVVIIMVSITSFIMVLISYLVNQGTTKIAQAKKLLSQNNQELTKTLEDLRKEKKSKDEFTSMLVHDLRSPLDAIRLIIEMAEGRKVPPLTKEISDTLRMINHSAVNMLNLVTNLLDVSKFERGKFIIKKELNDLNRLVLNQIKNYNIIAATRDIKINFQPTGEIPAVPFDEYALNRVVANLLTNAIKFTQSQGQITVCVLDLPSGKKIEELAKRFNINWFINSASPEISSTNNSILVAVTDNGIGIAKDKLNKLFLSFSQVVTYHGKVKTDIPLGTGLGLSIAKAVIGVHGGKINVSSAEDKGSTFYFSLPKN